MQIKNKGAATSLSVETRYQGDNDMISVLNRLTTNDP